MKTVSSCTGEEKPYIEEVVVYTNYRYNPNYGDDRICRCGHPYYRHFDWMEDNDAVGCKYCACQEFVEGSGDNDSQRDMQCTPVGGCVYHVSWK